MADVVEQRLPLPSQFDPLIVVGSHLCENETCPSIAVHLRYLGRNHHYQKKPAARRARRP